MSKLLEQVIEEVLDLPLEKRVAIARAILIPEDDPTGEELQIGDLDKLMPYEKLRRELGLGSHSKSPTTTRRR